MNLLLELVLKPSCVLLLALVALPLLRARSASLRHSVLAAALFCAAGVPLIGLLVPDWHLPLGMDPVSSSIAGLRSESTPIELQAATGTGLPRDARASFDMRLATAASPADQWALLRWIWLAGAAPGILMLTVGFRRLARLVSASDRIETGIWVERAEAIAREYGFRQPVTLLQTRGPALLVTWGVRRPRIVLPLAARDWPEDRVSVVLAHELAHIRRGDWIVQLTAEFLRALYWFNPLVWATSAILRQQSERACDDAVLNRGVAGSEYATHLVAIARDLRQGFSRVPAPAMARTSSLERRVRAMLDTRLNRRPVSRAAGVATLCALLVVTVFLAGFAPPQTAFASLTGSIVDPMNGAVPGVTLVLTRVDNDAKYEVRSNSSGRFEFVGLPPGDYVLRAQLPGFARYDKRLTMAGQDVDQDLMLQLGSLEETVNVSTDSAPAADPSTERRREAAIQREATKCTPGANAGGTFVGGNVRPPMKVKDARPRYPSDLRAAGVHGTVLLDARIGEDGMVREANVVSSPHPDLAAAAVEAVRQWEFDSTLLNCVPVGVRMKVTVNFRQ